MATIYKYVLEPREAQSIHLPVSATILSVAAQRDAICLWAKIPAEKAMAPSDRKINDTEAVRARTILMYGTGHQMPDHDDFGFLGTVLLHDGDLVLHIFEVK